MFRFAVDGCPHVNSVQSRIVTLPNSVNSLAMHGVLRGGGMMMKDSSIQEKEVVTVDSVPYAAQDGGLVLQF
jgi:hypothetical protein